MSTRAAAMVQTVRARCQGDERIRSALTYGSVPQGLDDAYSDAEFWIFPFAALDRQRWVREAVDPLHVVENEFGAVVAFLPGGFRIEMHLQPDVDEVRHWPSRGGIAVAGMVLLDRDGALSAALASVPEHAPVEAAETVCGRFLNWWLLGWNVLRRGEVERAHDALGHVRRHLLWMARLRTGSTARWLTPSRLAERDLPRADLDRLAATSAVAQAPALTEAYTAAARLGERWWRDLVATPPEAVLADVGRLAGARLRPTPLGWPG